MDNSSKESEENIQESSGEDLLVHEQMVKDYMPIPQLDTYGSSGIGTASQSESNPLARISAEREIRRRAIQKMRLMGKKVPLHLLAEEEEEMQRLLKEAPIEGSLRGLAPGEVPPANRATTRVSLEEFDFAQNTLADFLARENVQLEVRRRFRRFLSTFKIDNTLEEDELLRANAILDKENRKKKVSYYGEKIAEMCSENARSLDVSYIHLSGSEEVLAMWLADEPAMMLRLFDNELLAVVTLLYPNYTSNVAEDFSVRIVELPVIDELRNLRQVHLNGLVRVAGVVTKRSGINPKLKVVRFSCRNCQALAPTAHNAQEHQSSSELVKQILSGLRCEVCNSTSFEVNKTLTVYENVQSLRIQEAPGSVPAGRIPRSLTVAVSSDLVDKVKPGELVDVTGIYANVYNKKLNQQFGFPVFSTQIVANSLVPRETQKVGSTLTEEDLADIRKLAKRKNLLDLLISSFAPSLHGHVSTKRAVLLALVGGVAKDYARDNESTRALRIRGDINVLLIGDPGTAKSQLLKYAQTLAGRAIYASGRGSSAVGLTASVRADPLTREWTLEGGALVLADRGICLIDEFDKMREQDRTSIHEAMEQQTISVSKAGIVTTLSARCAVVAAANPVKGYYDSSVSVARNAGLSDAILSRFDVICPVRDEIDPVADEKLAEQVVATHMGKEKKEENKLISQELLRKYLVYVKSATRPLLRKLSKDKISKLYSLMRKEAAAIAGSVPIAVRHIESVIRISEAFAKLRLRDFVEDDDLNRAIQVVLESFIDGQKFGVKKILRKRFEKYLHYQVDDNEILLHLLNNIVREKLHLNGLLEYSEGPEEQVVEVGEEELSKKARELQIYVLKGFFTSENFVRSGYAYDPDRKIILLEFK